MWLVQVVTASQALRTWMVSASRPLA